MKKGTNFTRIRLFSRIISYSFLTTIIGNGSSNDHQTNDNVVTGFLTAGERGELHTARTREFLLTSLPFAQTRVWKYQ